MIKLQLGARDRLFLLLLFAGLLLRTPAWGAEKFIFGWSAISGAQAVPWIAKEAGLFEKHGLDTSLIYLDGGSKAVQTLLSGDVPVVLGAGNAAIAARVRGGDVVVTAGIVNNLAYSLIVCPEVKKTADLRGKKLAVSRFGANSDYATRKILLKWGLRPDRDVAIVQIPGGPPTRLRNGAKRPSGRHGRTAAGDEHRAQAWAQHFGRAGGFRRPEDFADLSFVKELDDSGFIDALYKGKAK